MATATRAKILLLEDDLSLQELISDYFTPRGYEFVCHTTAENGLGEIIKAVSNDTPFDLVLTDFRLPNMDGIEVIGQIKKVAPELPIILMTAHSSLDLAVEAIQKGAYDFVVKPLQFPQLSITMERAVYFSKLQNENKKLKSAIASPWKKEGNIVAKSPIMQSVVDLAKRVAKSNSTVLIQGESGSGKEVIAQLVHTASPRADKPFIAINCSAIPETLLESELFGHAKGSFTGADVKKIGLFEEANGGTLFLDEIGDLSLPLQAKLLRVIQDKKIKRVGENQYHDIDVRLITATHKDLQKEVREKRFREDLFFRLDVIPIKVPSLRDRKEDILPLAEHFLTVFKSRNPSQATGFSRGSLEFLLKNHWKGNVRELENAIERAVVLCDTQMIEPTQFMFASTETSGDQKTPAPAVDFESLMNAHESMQPTPSTSDTHMAASTAIPGPAPAKSSISSDSPGLKLLDTDELISLETLELRYIEHVLSQVNGVKDRAAKILQVDRKTLYRKLDAIHKRQQVQSH